MVIDPTNPKALPDRNVQRPGVYSIRNENNGRIYFGSSWRPLVRLCTHYKHLNEGGLGYGPRDHHNKSLKKDWDLGHKFTFELLQYTESREEADRIETYLIRSNPNTYNVGKNSRNYKG